MPNTSSQNLQQSQKHERHVAAKLSALYGKVQVQPGSGNQITRPNDVIAEGRCYIECKSTRALSLSVHLSYLVRMHKLAFLRGLRTILSIRFCFPQDVTYYVIDEDTLLHLLKCELEVEAAR